MALQNNMKDERIQQLESQLQQISIEMNELEQYGSKDCLLFKD